MGLKNKVRKAKERLEGLKAIPKATFLGVLQSQLSQQALKEIAEGLLVSPVDLDEMCSRVIPAFKKNPVTGATLKSLGVTDEELRNALKGALIDLGVEMK